MADRVFCWFAFWLFAGYGIVGINLVRMFT